MTTDPNDSRSKGGKARAERMSPEQRKEIAQKAAAARWSKDVPEALYGSPDNPLSLGGTEIQCFVLEDETRVLSQAGFLQALGRHRKANVRNEGGDERLPAILQGKAIFPYISEELREKSRPVSFRVQTGGVALGYRAEILPEVCEVYLTARDAGVLPHNQKHVAKQAEILIRALAHVGIIALVDEATGYQDVRARNALNEILEQFIAEELRKWTKVFPDDFYRQMFRLRDWEWKAKSVRQRPGVVGKYTNDLVYERLAPGVLDALKAKNPKLSKGTRKHRHHQWLTEDVGDPKLREHLASVITLMKASSDWEQFKRLVDRALPKFGATIEMPLDD
ncbi:P63C domain-containing protein [Roseovarius sp. D22-M7]|uniref:P63C domain-containing protein n=1 Tax=Roseovarius sp. D22-M7 TaxID=3127116 RepID=UPI00300F9E23